MTRKHWIDLFIGLLITALVLVGIELSLGAAGLGEVPQANNWSRGFDPEAKYLVPVPQTPGAWQTRFKHKTRPEILITPKSDKVRVLTFGGSNTAGFEVSYLEKLLNDGVGEERFETFNLGRPGYGSERVKFIFHQAVEELDPEIVVIYTGHNEFVERGFLMDLESAGAGEWAEIPLLVVRETHTFNAIVQHYADDTSAGPKEPEAWDNEYSKFADITYDETLQYFDAYEKNVRIMCEEALAKGIKVVLCTIVHNRLSVPFSSTFPDDMPQATIEEFEEKRKSALHRLPEYLKTLLPEKENQRLHAMEFSVRDRREGVPDEAFDRSDYTGWREATGFLKDRDPMLQHPSRWAPIVFQMYETVLSFQRREFGDKDKESILRAEKLLEEALAIYSEHPRALFELALTKHLLNRPENSIVALLNRAADLDRAPRKGSNATNDIVRRVAAEIDGVAFRDIDLAFQGCLPEGLIGWEWMADHCHLNRGGRDAIVEQFAGAILENWSDIRVGGEASH